MKWIKCSDQLPPKEGKFLYHYYCGIGLGCWGHIYTQSNGDSWDQGEKKYILILWPTDARDDSGSVFEWEETYMIEMNVSWMSLPEPPNEI